MKKQNRSNILYNRSWADPQPKKKDRKLKEDYVQLKDRPESEWKKKVIKL